MGTAIETTRSLFSKPKATDLPEVTLEVLLGELKNLNDTGCVKVDINSLEEEVRGAKTEEAIAVTREKLSYLIRIGRTFLHLGTTADDWRPLRGKRGGYVVLGGYGPTPEEYTSIMIAGFKEVAGPDAEVKFGDGGDPGICRLCGHRPVRYFYPLVCDSKKLTLLVGCECIVNYVDAVYPDPEDAAAVAKAMKRAAYVTRKIVSVNKKLDDLLDSGSGWGYTFRALIEDASDTDAIPPCVTSKMIEDAKRGIPAIRSGAAYTDKVVDGIFTAIKRVGFDATWRRVARKIARDTAADVRALEVCGTPERWAMLQIMANAEEDGRTFWKNSKNAIVKGWHMSARWIESIKTALDRETAKKEAPKVDTAPAPAVDDKIEFEGTIDATEFVERPRYNSFQKVKIEADNGWRVVVKDYGFDYSEATLKRSPIGLRVKVSGTVGWTKINGRIFVVLKGRKKITILD